MTAVDNELEMSAELIAEGSRVPFDRKRSEALQRAKNILDTLTACQIDDPTFGDVGRMAGIAEKLGAVQEIAAPWGSEGTGAAEPECQFCDKDRPCVCRPPVRGDREAIARLLASFDGNRFEGSVGITIQEHDKEIYRKRADRILSLRDERK